MSLFVSFSENHHILHEKLEFRTKMFSFCGVWGKSVKDDILVGKKLNFTNIAETL